MRAFVNGKLDLTQVEGLGDLLNAETEAQREQALRQMTVNSMLRFITPKGDLKILYNSWREKMIESLAFTNAVIEFGEEEGDVEDTLSKGKDKKTRFKIIAKESVKELLNEIKDHLKDQRKGIRLREGIHITLFGAPNAGKSTLLNWIAKKPLSIVSATPGTTRDLIEAFIDIGGYPVIIADTAGIRKAASDDIEAEGMKRALDRLQESDLKISVIDASCIENTPVQALEDSDLAILNKCDLITVEKANLLLKRLPCKSIKTSLKTGTNLSELLNLLIEKIRESCDHSERPLPTQQRHSLHLKQCQILLERSLNSTDSVLFAEDLQSACRQLEYLTGRISLDDVLNRLFAGFCIGK